MVETVGELVATNPNYRNYGLVDGDSIKGGRPL